MPSTPKCEAIAPERRSLCPGDAGGVLVLLVKHTPRIVQAAWQRLVRGRREEVRFAFLQPGDSNEFFSASIGAYTV